MEELIKLLVNIFGDDIEVMQPSELESTIPDMLSKDYKDRFKAEYKQTLIRYQRLCRIIKGYEKNKTIYGTPLKLLQDQLQAMGKYLNILADRAILEGIDITL